MASITKQSKETQERHRRVLLDLLRRPENQECADCRARNPTWASINLGVFLCIRCSGLHRQIGVHITKVRSCTMDLWEPDQIAFMASMGNKKAKAMWEGKLPTDYGKPAENEDSSMVLQWIRAKYEKKKYFNPCVADSAPQQQGSTHASPNAVASRKKKPSQADGSPTSEEGKQMPTSSVWSSSTTFQTESAFSFLNGGTGHAPASTQQWVCTSFPAGDVKEWSVHEAAAAVTELGSRLEKAKIRLSLIKKNVDLILASQ